MTKVVKVQSWMRNYFTPSELSGWSSWVDVAGSLSEEESRRLAKAKRRAARAARKNEQIEYTVESLILT